MNLKERKWGRERKRVPHTGRWESGHSLAWRAASEGGLVSTRPSLLEKTAHKGFAEKGESLMKVSLRRLETE